jgi:septal ring factor EnvC (AmiA/AmiB activator)
MNFPAEFERCPGDLPTGSAMSDAIDVLARLVDQAERMAGNGKNELAMSEALSASFAYMVAYFHHLAIAHREPHDALSKAAAGIPELETAELDFLRACAAQYAA